MFFQKLNSFRSNGRTLCARRRRRLFFLEKEKNAQRARALYFPLEFSVAVKRNLNCRHGRGSFS